MSEERRTERQVRKASPDAVVTAINRFSQLTKTWPKLATTSPIYNFKFKQHVNKIFETEPDPKDQQLLADYLGHSMTGHLFDGWRYLSQALMAIACGARGKAAHLAYYAELRAAFSILASSGIGIHNARNFALDEDGNVHWFGGRTHVATWTALQAWAKRSDTSRNIYSVFRCADLDGNQWAAACDPVGTGSDIPERWINDWAVDLSKIKEDQNLRNLWSYNPDLTASALQPIEKKDIQLITAIKRTTFATSPGNIRDLDRAIIRQLSDFYFDRQVVQPQVFWDNVKNNLHTVVGISLDDARKKVVQLQKATPRAVKSVMAYAQGGKGEDAGPHNLICRGLILLRLATGFMRLRWSDSNRSPMGAASTVWCDDLLLNFAIASSNVDIGATIVDAIKIDSDELLALAEVETELQTISGRQISGNALWASHAVHLSNLTRLERICVRATV